MPDPITALARKWCPYHSHSGFDQCACAAIAAAVREALGLYLELENAAHEIIRLFHPKGSGWGTCFYCTLAGGAHSKSCCIGQIVAAIAALRGGEVMGWLVEMLRRLRTGWRHFLCASPFSHRRRHHHCICPPDCYCGGPQE